METGAGLNFICRLICQPNIWMTVSVKRKKKAKQKKDSEDLATLSSSPQEAEISWSWRGSPPPWDSLQFSTVPTDSLLNTRAEPVHIYYPGHFLLHLLPVCMLSPVQLFATPWTVACQTPLSLGFSKQEFWSVLPFPSPWDLPNPGMKPGSPASSALQVDSLLAEPLGSPLFT